MTDEGWLYLAGVKDIFTCELVGYAMGPRMTQDLTAQALWCAVRSKRPASGLIHHSVRESPILRRRLPETGRAVRHAGVDVA